MSAFAAWFLPPGRPDPSRISLSSAEGEELSLRHPVLSEEEVRDLCGALAEARAGLLDRGTDELTAALGKVGERFLDPADPLRREAMELLVPGAGLSPAMTWEVVRGMARDWTAARLSALVSAEFPDPGVLEGFRPQDSGGSSRALGPELVLHVGAGTVPGVSVGSLIRALLVRSPVLVKPGRGDAVLPVLFARGLAEQDSELARAVAVLYWPGGEGIAEEVALSLADHVVVHGDDETVTAVRERLPATTRLTAYHHRVSFGLVGRGALGDEEEARSVARAAARSVAVFDQRGCVSPHLFYVEEGGGVAPEAWAEALALALESLERELPAGPLREGEAATIHQVRGSAELRAAGGTGAVVHAGEGLAWTVLFDPDPAFQASCLGRTVRVKPVSGLEDVPALVGGISRVLQTAGIAGAEGRVGELAEALGRSGVSRVTTLERIPWPPPWWHHDGLRPLGSLTRWVDLEGGDPAGDGGSVE